MLSDKSFNRNKQNWGQKEKKKWLKNGEIDRLTAGQERHNPPRGSPSELTRELSRIIVWNVNQQRIDRPVPFTVGQINQEPRSKHWAFRTSVRWFACTAHSFTCFALLTSLARSAALTRLHARSIPSLVGKWMIRWLFILRFFRFRSTVGLEGWQQVEGKNAVWVMEKCFENKNDRHKACA